MWQQALHSLLRDKSHPFITGRFSFPAPLFQFHVTCPAGLGSSLSLLDPEHAASLLTFCSLLALLLPTLAALLSLPQGLSSLFPPLSSELLGFLSMNVLETPSVFTISEFFICATPDHLSRYSWGLTYHMLFRIAFYFKCHALENVIESDYVLWILI